MRDSLTALIGSENIGQPIAKKVMIGLPFYGYRFPSSAGSPSPIVGHEVISLLRGDPAATVTYHEQWAEHSITCKNAAGVTETIFYPTLHFLQQRIDLARDTGASIAIWEAGQGLDIFYDLL